MKQIGLLILAMALSQVVNAQSSKKMGRQGGSPPEAIQACSSSSEGDACSFEDRRGKSLAGTCSSARQGKLTCKPEKQNQRGERPSRDEGVNSSQ